MIFGLVGPHEQPFNRLVMAIDYCVSQLEGKQEAFIQVGYSTYAPRYAKYRPFLHPDKIKTLVDSADIVICHGGPGSISLAFECGKIPIVFPRGF